MAAQTVPTTAATNESAPTAGTPTARRAVPGRDADDGHVDDVGSQRCHAAVSEQQRLHDEHDGDTQCTGEGAYQDRGERAAEQVPADAGQDREVDHLDREDERRHQTRQGHGPLVQLGAGAVGADTERQHGDPEEEQGDRGVDDTVAHVHGKELLVHTLHPIPPSEHLSS